MASVYCYTVFFDIVDTQVFLSRCTNRCSGKQAPTHRWIASGRQKLRFLLDILSTVGMGRRSTVTLALTKLRGTSIGKDTKMANKARNTVRSAANKAAANKPAKQEQAQTPAPEDNTKFIGKLVKVNGGRKHNGETLKCYHVTKGSSFRAPAALCEGKETLGNGVSPIFVQPKFLEIVGDMPKADFDRLRKMQEDQSTATVYVTAFTRGDNAVREKAIRLSNKDWPTDIWFANDMYSTTGAETPDGEKIFEVVAWKLRKTLGNGMFKLIENQQDELTKIVNAG